MPPPGFPAGYRQDKALWAKYMHEYYWRNPEKARAQARKTRAKWIDKVKFDKKKHYAANRVAILAKRKLPEKRDRDRFSQYRKRYGLSREQYTAMLEQQDGLCAICRRPQQRAGRTHLYVDHDPQTGRVRALLCHRCNAWLLGRYTSPMLQRAIDILASDFDGRSLNSPLRQ